MTVQLLPEKPRKPKTWEYPLASQEQLKSYQWPADYSQDTVCEGYSGKTADGKEVNYITKIHAVKPNGKLACACPVAPSKTGVSVFNYCGVQTPLDFRELYCEESAEFMRSEITRLEQKGKVNVGQG